MAKWPRYTWRTGAALFVTWIVCVVGASWYWQITIGKPMEREFGFRIGTPIIQEDRKAWPQEVVSIESLRWEGVLGQAGFRQDDIIYGLSVSDVFKVLHRGRGKQVTLRVVNGGDGPPLSERPVREITFKVPTAQ